MPSPNLIFSRHGNTFAAADPAVWVGAKNDLPLVDSGVAQAEKLASAIAASGITVDAIYCGPLKRTRQYAEIVRRASAAEIAVFVDERLNELDYGDWSGLNDAQIVERFGRQDLDNWNDKGHWPLSGRWGGSETEIKDEIESFLQDLKNAYTGTHTVLCITSNGRLRCLLKLFPDAYTELAAQKKLKVGTGKICLLMSNEKNDLKPAGWNLDPAEALIKNGLLTKNPLPF